MLHVIPVHIVEFITRAVVALDVARRAAVSLGARTWDDRYAIDLVRSTQHEAERLYLFRQAAPARGVDPDVAIHAVRGTIAYRRLRDGVEPLSTDWTREHQW